MRRARQVRCGCPRRNETGKSPKRRGRKCFLCERLTTGRRIRVPFAIVRRGTPGWRQLIVARDAIGTSQTIRTIANRRVLIRVRQFACVELPSAVRPVVAYDYMIRRILQLTIPFTFSAVFETVVELVFLAILVHRMGTDDMIA